MFRKSNLAILIAHVQKPPKPLPELMPGLPSLVWELVSRSLEKTPAKRFASAEEFADKIEELQPYLGRSTREVPAQVVKAVRASSAPDRPGGGAALVTRTAPTLKSGILARRSSRGSVVKSTVLSPLPLTCSTVAACLCVGEAV